MYIIVKYTSNATARPIITNFPKNTITIGMDESYNLTAILKNKKESDVKIHWVICPYIDSKPNEFYAHAIASHSLTATISKPAGMTDKAMVKCYVESSSGAVQTACINVIFRDKNDPKSNILAFVERIYTYVLNREPESEGAAYWSDELWSFRRTGAEVAQGFIFSEEFENRKTTDDEFLTILYRTFFDREPDDGGMDYWRGQLKSGAMDRITVANGFIYSQEWADTCASYGIRSGGDLKPTSKIEPTVLTYAFVERMYTTALGRGYDEGGRQYWASCLADFETTGETVGAFFFLSDEMNSYGLSDKDYLTRLYATFMDREPDNDGMSFWLEFMKTNDRQATVMGFTRSPEFAEKCIEARILPY